MALNPDHPQPVDNDRQFTFVVKVQSYGRGDDAHLRQISGVLWKHLNHGFGADRVEVWSEGGRIYFDPDLDAQLP